MPKWEYLYIVCFLYQDDWFPRRVNGREVPDWREGPTLAEFSNQLGQDGWELVNASPQGYSGAMEYYVAFKRPVAQD